MNKNSNYIEAMKKAALVNARPVVEPIQDNEQNITVPGTAINCIHSVSREGETYKETLNIQYHEGEEVYLSSILKLLELSDLGSYIDLSAPTDGLVPVECVEVSDLQASLQFSYTVGELNTLFVEITYKESNCKKFEAQS